MNLKHVYRQLKKRKELKHFEVRPIGSALRIKRKEMKMTLEEGAEGICSVSYLSKLETNQIVPNLDFVDRLVERFGLKEKIAYDSEQFESDFNDLKHFMFQLEQPSFSYMENYIEREDHQALIIRLIEFAITKNCDQALHYFQELVPFLPHLKDEELTMVLLSAAEAFVLEENYQDAYRMATEIPKTSESNEHLHLLTLRLKLIISFLEHKPSDLMTKYHTYIQEVESLGYYHLAKEMKRYLLVYLAQYHLPDEILKLSICLDRERRLSNLPYAIACFMHQDYEKVVLLARDQKPLNDWLMIYLLAMERTSRFEEIKHTINHRIPDTLNKTEKLILTHFIAKYEKDEKGQLHYLRRDLLGNRISSDNPICLEYIMMDASRWFAKYQFYKEAYLVIQQYQPRIKKLRLAMKSRIDEV